MAPSSRWSTELLLRLHKLLAAPSSQRALYFYLKLMAWLTPRLRRIDRFSKQHPVLRYSALVSACLVLLSATSGVLYFARVAGDVNGSDLDVVPEMEESTKVYDRNGALLHEFYEKKRTVVPLNKVSKDLRHAILAIEDRNFYDHSGYDLGAIVRAAVANLTSGKVKQGGSTLTQQLAKNTFLTSERSYRRKIQEIWLARKIEKTYSKDQILEFYVNRVYFGSGFYGVEAAAQGYFGKPASDLTLGEAALLAGLAKAPGLYCPHANGSLAEKRRNVVLAVMAACGHISAEQAAAASRQPLEVRPRRDDQGSGNNYALDYVREQLLTMVGYEQIYSGGLKVYTTIDARMQRAAEASVEDYLSRVEKQRRFDRLSRANHLAQHSGRTHAGHAEDERPDYLQGALVSMGARTGEIFALVGGRNFKESKYNRAVHAQRQPGSAFKPFVYAAALATGMTPATVVEDREVEIETDQGVWRPSNAPGKHQGSMTLRRALRSSVNTVAVQLGQLVGVHNVARTARDFGIEAELPMVQSLPLGVAEVTLLEMVRAYSAFPGEGRIAEPTIVLRVETRNGQILFEHHPSSRQAVAPQTAFLMTTMLADAVSHGTGAGVRAAGFRGAAAGKTGTSNDYRDAWFLGFTPEVVTGVWVGFDAPRQIMNRGYGATLAVPIWAQFMKSAFPKVSKNEFSMPPGITRATVCSVSGQLATEYCPSATEYFSEDNVPRYPCRQHLNHHLLSTYGQEMAASNETSTKK